MFRGALQVDQERQRKQMTDISPEFELRTTLDRLRHTVLFETILLLAFVPLGAYFFQKSFIEIGGLAVALSVIAMGSNYLFNIAFDHTLLKLGRPLQPRSARLRALHAVLFEVTLLIFSVPLLAFVLEISLLSALLIDVGFLLITPVVTFAYNWLYDIVFPMKVKQAPDQVVP